MNAATKIGIALMVLAVFVFQPFTKCFATPAKAMSHHCCPPPAKAECKVASCVCETTDSTSAPVPASSDSAHGVPMLATAEAETPAFVVPRIAVYERSRLAVNDRFIVLHQFLI